MNKKEMMSILTESDEVKPIAEVNGNKVYDFQGAQKLNKADLLAEKLGKEVELGERKLNPDGVTYASGNYKNRAADPEVLYANSCRVIDKAKKLYEVVIDYRAINEKKTGHVYANDVIAYVIEVKEDAVSVKSTNILKAETFINDFKDKFSIKSMLKITAAIIAYQSSGADASGIDI